ncbi:tRNA pseudouridine(38-40) synthase TruA [Cesiribacter andamanensis]|uniref:tRNA pseudouridine synthase A n=1 Tax=Cesiribacter andamanensis AMV16 TaxID=1279009 RepID=M7N4U5_9BACT|nr:tRNA pseudouridine(38-40) synthase TruA [Cesiribacter andamanensis]EMR02246.1 tRNA pseudouridine synthase A [Cesiribacter andamanensis AMV16]
MRYFLDIAYNGARYHGWQLQNNAHTLQAEVEEGLGKLFRQPMRITGSGRTDTGVHAEQQLVHFDVELDLLSELDLWLHKINAVLPPDIWAKSLRPVSSEAHARYSALSRRYQYRISRHKDPFRQQLVYYFPRPLDVAKMNEAAALMLQWEDFECFSKIHTNVKHFRCTVWEARWEETEGGLIFYIAANRFLRNMVRAIVGTLLQVGQGRMTVPEFQQVLESRDRSRAGRSAPADGLFLVEVQYPTDIYV